MAALEGNDLVSAIAVAIRAGIPKDDLPYIYKDKPRQNFKYCSLYIDVVNSEQSLEMRRRGQRTDIIDLRLHPLRDQDTAQSWCRSMAEKIQFIIERFDFMGRPIRARLIDCQYLEDEQIMHILAVYSYKTLRVNPNFKPSLFMEDLDVNEELKYGKE